MEAPILMGTLRLNSYIVQCVCVCPSIEPKITPHFSRSQGTSASIFNFLSFQGNL